MKRQTKNIQGYKQILLFLVLSCLSFSTGEIRQRSDVFDSVALPSCYFKLESHEYANPFPTGCDLDSEFPDSVVFFDIVVREFQEDSLAKRIILRPVKDAVESETITFSRTQKLIQEFQRRGVDEDKIVVDSHFSTVPRFTEEELSLFDIEEQRFARSYNSRISVVFE